MANITELEVRDPKLLLRYLKQQADLITSLQSQLAVVTAELAKVNSRVGQTSQQISSKINELNVNNRIGELAQPQKPKAKVFAATPTGSELDSMEPDEIFIVTGVPNTLWRVVGGNPHTASQIL